MADSRIFINQNKAEYKAEINGKWVEFHYLSTNTVEEVLTLRPNLKFIGTAERFLSKFGKEYSMYEKNIFINK